jgi:hypothetical protein
MPLGPDPGKSGRSWKMPRSAASACNRMARSGEGACRTRSTGSGPGPQRRWQRHALSPGAWRQRQSPRTQYIMPEHHKHQLGLDDWHPMARHGPVPQRSTPASGPQRRWSGTAFSATVRQLFGHRDAHCVPSDLMPTASRCGRRTTSPADQSGLVVRGTGRHSAWRRDNSFDQRGLRQTTAGFGSGAIATACDPARAVVYLCTQAHAARVAFTGIAGTSISSGG